MTATTSPRPPRGQPLDRRDHLDPQGRRRLADDLSQPRDRDDRHDPGHGLEERLDAGQLLRQVQGHRGGQGREDHRRPAAHPHPPTAKKATAEARAEDAAAKPATSTK